MKSGAEQHKQFSVQCTHFLQQLKAVMKSQVRSFLPYFLLLAAASAWCLMRSSRHAAAPPSDKSQTVPLSPLRRRLRHRKVRLQSSPSRPWLDPCSCRQMWLPSNEHRMAH